MRRISELAIKVDRIDLKLDKLIELMSASKQRRRELSVSSSNFININELSRGEVGNR